MSAAVPLLPLYGNNFTLFLIALYLETPDAVYFIVF